MKTITKILLSLSVAGILTSCDAGKNQENGNGELSVIPQPVNIKISTGSFEIKNHTTVYCKSDSLVNAGKYLSQQLGGLEIKSGSGGGINLIIADEEVNGIGSEGYKLNITNRRIDIIANEPAGIFYGIQTLLQMLPPVILNSSGQDYSLGEVSCSEIEDYPRFKWRGLLLDVSRHFFTIDEVKELIDQMAAYKFNILQLHLTDDQGWRIEIKSMPELTDTGAWRVPRTGLWWDREPPKDGEKATYGGFYTQEEIKDLVKYAAERYVNILPEIEAPGHSLAAIASYPYLSSSGKEYKVNPGSKFYGIEDNSLCPGKETTFEYLDKVFSEVAELFPFEYIHIGGDECYKGFWEKCSDCRARAKENGLKDMKELQSYFVKRLEKILESKGKKLIGWDEILEGGLAPNAAVMSWRGMEGGIAAAKAQHKVVMSPFSHAYIDFYQGDPAVEPPTYAMLRLNKVYTFEPVPEGVDSSYILGGQGNLWTESVPSFRHAEYMLWPRSFALSEVFWSPANSRDWPGFVRRTEYNLKRLNQKDINYSTSFYDAIIEPSKDEKGNLLIQLDTEIDGLDIYYTFDNTLPDHHSQLYIKGDKLTIPADADTFRVITYRDGKAIGKLIAVPVTDLVKRVQ
ncbi:MAG: family 20 glycosylhydrolase [Bacteroidales bacterium]|nr:family 20 glycosylhydrolase [Bacteroidales bacterium]